MTDPPDQRVTTAQLRAEWAAYVERRNAVSRIRTDVVELAMQMESAIDLALALYHARTPDAAYALYTDVFWRVPFGVRVDQLSDALDDVGLADNFPFVVPVARKVIHTRNLLAHSLAEPTDDGVWVRARWRGKVSEQLIRDEYLRWLIPEGQRCNHELDLISGRIGDWRVWAALHGFDDRSPVDGS